MHSVIENRITGFEFFPEYEKNREQNNLSSLKVELLEDGEVISTEIYKNISKEQFERLQLQLLDTVAVNLDLGENWISSKKISRNSKIHGVVNMFKIEKIKEHKDGSKDIRIVFLKSGNYTSESEFDRVTDEQFKKIKSMLADNMAYNFKAETQCNAVTYIDFIAVIDQLCKTT